MPVERKSTLCLSGITSSPVRTVTLVPTGRLALRRMFAVLLLPKSKIHFPSSVFQHSAAGMAAFVRIAGMTWEYTAGGTPFVATVTADQPSVGHPGRLQPGISNLAS